jgi:hypothetical protein
VLDALVPGLAFPAPAARALRRLGELLAEPPPGLAADRLLAGLLVWLAPLSLALRRRTLARLALTGRPAARVAAFPALERRLEAALRRPAGRGADDARLRALPAEELLALAASAPASVRRRVLRHAREDRARALPLDGDDLLALGLAGPAVGRALAALRRACLDGRVAGRAEALAFVERLARRGRS